MPVFIGTAGWTIPGHLKTFFPDSGTHLERYASVFNCVEVNSAFYREHRRETYEKWASMVPEDFLFSVKLSRIFTQKAKLTEGGVLLEQVLHGIAGLGKNWGGLVVQLPPSLGFSEDIVEAFLMDLRKYYGGAIFWEPRHVSWAGYKARELLQKYRINKILADPERCKIQKAQRPSLENIRYLRLHGTPEIYKSRYEPERLERIAECIMNPISSAEQTWCIFDNTTFGYATENAIELKDIILKPGVNWQRPRPGEDSLSSEKLHL